MAEFPEVIPLPEGSSASALEQLRQLLAQHSGQPGEALPTERELCRRFSAGRRAVRRALDVLEEEGRIWRKQGKGTFIGPEAPAQPLMLQALPKQSNLLEVMEARLQLEPGLVRYAALRATPEQIALLHRILERLRQLDDHDADQVELWDSAFHRTIAEAAGNRLMLGLFDAVDAIRRDPSWLHLRQQARTGERLAHYDDHHHRIVQHIAARQPAEGAAVMHEHLLALHQALLAAITHHEGEA
ncbi:FadR/GntR family transcriptional regulator [Nissabacter sp. SGAir0207]|uniref:FadR/GntR family transcriptional regulator n=1 Tax=Nissabacter sp. SGAir0207 TaxID=2126321 RepID=UPI0010CD2D30|nr:FCD domain-containing protein [Nissabacter sp. SGAir0207]QCR37837.1 FadR family transcriptional regulator [Nissabacter sp. SGAir0207]